jgi:hypothetical protein
MSIVLILAAALAILIGLSAWCIVSAARDNNTRD